MQRSPIDRVFRRFWSWLSPGLRRELAEDAELTFRRRRRQIRQREGALAGARYVVSNLVALGVAVARQRVGSEPAGQLLATTPRERPIISLLHDLRQALRASWRAPAFTLLVAATLALGIGLHTAMFATLRAVVLAPLPYSEPERLVAVNITLQGSSWWAASLADVLEWRAGARSLDSIAFALPVNVNLAIDEGAEQLVAARTSANFFDTLGVEAARGRTFAPGEDSPESDRVAVLDGGFWRRRFGADPSVLGRALVIDGEPTTVVGILPDDMRADFLGNPQVWITRRFAPEDVRDRARVYIPVARLAAGVGLETAAADLERVASHVEVSNPETMAGWGAVPVPLHQAIAGGSTRPLGILFAAVGLVLLVACANISSLLLARATTRRRELAVRIALGAGRARLSQLLLIETLVFALLGCLLGLPLASIATRLIASVPNGPPRLDQTALDSTTLAFAVLAAAGSAVIAGVMPALRGARGTSRACLSEGSAASGAGTSGRLRTSLVVAEVALVALLLIGAGLLIRSYGALRGVDPGFDPRNSLVIQIDLATNLQHSDIPRLTAFYRELRAQLASLPSVESVGDVTRVPMISRTGMTAYHLVEGQEWESGSEPVGGVEVVSPSYFDVMRMPLLRGRGFSDDDDAASAPVVIVNDAMARLYWPAADPIGARLAIGPASNGAEVATLREVVGIVMGVRYGLDLDVRPRLYLPDDQMPMPMSGRGVILHTAGRDPLDLVADVRRVVAEIDPYQAIGTALTFEQVIDRSLASRRLQTLLLSGFGGVALLLGSLGVYGLVSHAVTQRTHEMGVRMALGAARRDVLRLVLRSALRPVLIGLALGTAGALGLSHTIASMVFGVTATDPPTFVTVAVVLLAVAVVAAWIPARRATRVDPVRSLRFVG